MSVSGFNGRRLRWASQIEYLLGRELYERVVYFDVVGCSFSSSLQTIVLTSKEVYLYPVSTKKKPLPYCQLTDIEEVIIDNKTPKTFQNAVYESHRIIIKVYGLYHALYTFDKGTELPCKIKNIVENAKRHQNKKDAPISDVDPSFLRIRKDMGCTTLTYYTNRFNQLVSYAIHETNYGERMKALKNLECLSHEFFPVKVLFFQSDILIQTLVGTIVMFSNVHTVPISLKSTRIEQIALIRQILDLIMCYLRGSESIKSANRIILQKQGDQYKKIINSVFKIEFHILSQPTIVKFFVKGISNIENLFDELQKVEMSIPSILYQLYMLSNLCIKQKVNVIKKGDIFFDTITETEDTIVKNGLHCMTKTLVQMGRIITDGKELHEDFAYCLLDHLWFIDYMMSNFPSARKMVKENFEVDIFAILTDDRISKEHFLLFPLFDNMKYHLQNIKNSLTTYEAVREGSMYLPVLFR